MILVAEKPPINYTQLHHFKAKPAFRAGLTARCGGYW